MARPSTAKTARPRPQVRPRPKARPRPKKSASKRNTRPPPRERARSRAKAPGLHRQGKSRPPRAGSARRPVSAGPWPAALSLLMGSLGAAVYFFGVHFSLGNGGATLGADRTAATISVVLAALLCLAGVLGGGIALRRPGRRVAAAIGMLLSVAFLSFCVLSLVR